MSPIPSSDSAPFWSRITRESVCDETANAMREGTFGLDHAGDHVDPRASASRARGGCRRARAFLRQADHGVLDVGRRDHHQVRQLVDHAQHVGQRRITAARRAPG